MPVRAPWLERAIPIARNAGLDVHAWMWCMPCLVPEIVRDHAEWYNVNAKGESAVDKPAYVGYYKFMDPAHPEVRAFVRETVNEKLVLLREEVARRRKQSDTFATRGAVTPQPTGNEVAPLVAKASPRTPEVKASVPVVKGAAEWVARMKHKHNIGTGLKK